LKLSGDDFRSIGLPLRRFLQVPSSELAKTESEVVFRLWMPVYEDGLLIFAASACLIGIDAPGRESAVMPVTWITPALRLSIAAALKRRVFRFGRPPPVVLVHGFADLVSNDAAQKSCPSIPLA